MPASTRGAKRPRSGSDIVTSPSARIVLAVLRIVVGFIFLWTFLDKTFGLGFSTPRQMAWIHGGQPAQGFIKGVAVHSPFGSAFELLANPVGDWLFMAGMLGVGVALTLGIGLNVSAFPVAHRHRRYRERRDQPPGRSSLGSDSVCHPVRPDSSRRHPGAGRLVVSSGRGLLAALMSPSS